jgi:serine/threonine protein kinase
MKIPGADRYRIKSSLGQGPAGMVYKAWDTGFKRHVAVKIAHKGAGYFIAENRLVGNLVHRNIVTIYKVETVLGVSYIAMEYVKGTDLRLFCNKGHLLQPRRVIELMIEVLKGLFHGHGKRFIHGNIKPSNIILNENGVPKIIDFGITKMKGKDLEGGFLGAPDYMSPEQLKDKPATMQSDIFSLGCVLFEMLKGEKPFRASSKYDIINNIINNNPEPLPGILPCKETLEPIINKALSKDPDERYQGCGEFACDLSKALGLVTRQEQLNKSSILKSLTDRVHVFKGISAPIRN